jgi:hypothetical protein
LLTAANGMARLRPITPYLKGSYYFDLETKRALGMAFETGLHHTGHGEGDDHVKQAIVSSLPLGRAGERNPEVLCDKVLEDICRPEHDKPSTPDWGEARSDWQLEPLSWFFRARFSRLRTARRAASWH